MTLSQFEEKTSEIHHIKGALEGNFTNGYVNCGQVAGLIDHTPTVKELIVQIVNEATEAIQYVGRGFHSLQR